VKSEKHQITQIKEHLTSTARAIVADESVHLEFNDDCQDNFFSWNQGLVLGNFFVLPQISKEILKQVQDDSGVFQDNSPHRHPELDSGSIFAVTKSPTKQFRAASDLAACYFMYHSHNPNQQTQRNAEEQKFFNEFEKIRVIANVKSSYLGVVQNLLQKIEDDIFSGSTNLSLILLQEIFGKKLLGRTANIATQLATELKPKIVKEIRNLNEKLSDQNEFELGVEKVLEMLKNDQDSSEDEENDEQDESSQNNELPKEEANFGQENVEQEDEQEFDDGQETSETQVKQEELKVTDFKEDKKGGPIKVKSEKVGFDEDKIEFRNAYKVFTSKFDEVVFPQKLVNKNDLELLRDQLDLKMARLDSISKKMSLKLKRKLMAKKNSYVERDNSSGVLDRKKLTQFVLDPFMEDIWVNNKENEYQDTALTILLDNSGSMRGNPIVMSALACEIIAGILEKFAIKTEIIGFTTADWKGGKARKMWEHLGRPENPGRLNELRHIIYKSSNQSFKKARVNLGLMLKEGILKENIDGEALLFAKARLMQRDEKRKILMVISDGTPIDDSTNSANDSDILSDHLRHAINKIEKQTRIEIVGIGIGHATDDFYQNSITIKSLEELGDVMIEKLVDLL
jgi:cobaltochelatase CobT